MYFAGNGYSNAVDIFNVISGQWTTASLSVARSSLAATSLPNQGLAIFAGGFNGEFFPVDSACFVFWGMCIEGQGWWQGG
jgi:hypothetical protein